MDRTQIRTLDLLALLNRELHATDEAFFACRFTSVETLESPDEAGCNWRTANLQCVEASAHETRRVAEELIAQARGRFNVTP